ncbi:MAG TPA: YcaO-like family protein [Candidatus Cybelea sp.]|nr:YcaO-like family protein [Candidatus Cybelea sp.]
MISLLAERTREPSAPQFFHYYAKACDAAALGGESNFRLGGGASSERDRAMGKAIGEAIERYCSAFYFKERLPLVSANDASFSCVDPAAFALYREDQYAAQAMEFVPFTADLPVRWVEACDVATSRSVYVPAATVFMPYFYGEAEGAVMQPITTGLACNEGYESALLSAICEAIERDSFTIFWQGRLAPPRVPLESLDPAIADLVDRFARARYDVTLFNVTTDIGVPSLLTVARHEDPSHPALCVAAATHPVASVAARKGLEELEHTRLWCKRLKRATPPIDPQKTAEILEQEEHLRFWCEHSNRHLADWLFSSTLEEELPAVAFSNESDPAELLTYVRGLLKMADLQLFAVDVTTPEILALGLNVVKAVVPGLHPLFIGHRHRALGGRRLYEVPVRLGYGPPELPLDDPTNPHPFP